jgi:hypothetical protein
MNMVYLTNYLISMTIVFAAVTGILKWNKIRKEDRPIIIGWWIIVVNETVRFILLCNNNKTLIPYNTYVLPLMWVYVWQFQQWKVLTTKLAWLIIATLTMLWVAVYFVVDGYNWGGRQNIYKLCLSLTLVILSVASLNVQIITEKKSLIKSHRFLICLGITIYYTYRVFVDVFFLKKLSPEFLISIGNLNRYLIQVYYLLLLLAAIWIPRRKNFIHPL